MNSSTGGTAIRAPFGGSMPLTIGHVPTQSAASSAVALSAEVGCRPCAMTWDRRDAPFGKDLTMCARIWADRFITYSVLVSAGALASIFPCRAAQSHARDCRLPARGPARREQQPHRLRPPRHAQP